MDEAEEKKLSAEASSAIELEGVKDEKTRRAWMILAGVNEGDTEKEEAVQILEERVKEGDSDAMWILGLCCEYGIGIDRDSERKEMLFKQSHDLGNEIGSFFSVNNDRMKGLSVTFGKGLLLVFAFPYFLHK